jgi:hypothetical protein
VTVERYAAAGGVVPADEVRAIVEATDRELRALEDRLAAATAAADAAEAEARAAGVSEGSSVRSMIELQQVLEQLRVRAEEDADRLLDAARGRAVDDRVQPRIAVTFDRGIADPLAESHGEPLPAPAARDFWEPIPDAVRRARRRVPVSAALEIVAVVAVLVFVLLRLG